MANIVPVDNWSDIPQIEQTNKVLGGEGQIANQQAQALANRVENLKNTVNSNKTAQDNKNDSIDTAINDLSTNKVNKSDVVNNATTTASGKVLDGRMGKTLNDAITSNYNTLNTNKVNKSDIVTNYTTNDNTKVLSASVGVALKALIDGKQAAGSYVLTSNIVNNATTTASGKVLDGRMGKTLNDTIVSNYNTLNTNKVNKSDIADNLTTNNASKVLSAKQGYVLKGLIDTANTNINTKLAKTDVVNNLTTTASGKALDARQGKTLNDAITSNYNTLNTNKVNKSDIVDNLTTNDATKVLSAKQGKVLNEKITSYVPVGTILPYMGNSSTPPTGFLFCNGATNLSKTTYANLYAVLGDAFSVTSTTFKIPDLRQRFLEGHFAMGNNGIVMGYLDAGLPNIKGGPTSYIAFRTGSGVYPTVTAGAFYFHSVSTGSFAGSSSWGIGQLAFDASKSNAIYGKSTTVQPPAVTCNFIIKY